MQTRRDSAIEVSTSFVIGLAVNWLIVLTCIKLIADPVAAATASTAACSVHSIVRGYVIRRWFARREA